MKKQEALKVLKEKTESVDRWMKIVEKDINKDNIHIYMVVLGNTIQELLKSFNSLKTKICLGWDK